MKDEVKFLRDLGAKDGDTVVCVDTDRPDWFTSGKQYDVFLDGSVVFVRDDEGDPNSAGVSARFCFVAAPAGAPSIDLSNPLGQVFGLMAPEVQEAMKAHGGPYDIFSNGDWCVNDRPIWVVSMAYRVRPAPEVKAPKEVWCVVHSNSSEAIGVFQTAQDAKKYCQQSQNLTIYRYILAEETP